jgi:hypothetical protein
MSKWGRGRVAAFLASAAWLLAAPVGAQAATFSSDPSATSLGREIATDSSLVVGASYVAKPPVGGSAAIGEGEIAGLPTHGPKFGVLSTGRAAIAGNANSSESSGQSLNGPNVRGNTDYDVTILKIDVDVPQTANCLMGLDFRFASEEYAEWVGSGFNDAFVAEVDQSTWTTNGSTINAPRNFAFDPTGAPISINAAGVTSMRREFAAGTTYDGATPLLTAATPIQPGRHSIYLSIFDQGDRIYDSAVFLDNLRVGRVADVQRDCKPGADLADDRRYYALGDSYSSGFGVSPYEPGTNGDAGPNDCQRSTRAYSQLVASDLGLDLSFHACQGAVTRDFYEPRNSTWGELAQLEYLKPDAGLVTYGIGGNDAGFADAIRDCIDGWELLPWNTCHEDERVAEPVQEAIERLDNRRATPAEIRPYDRINKDVRQRTPFATRVAVGYPPLFPAEGGDRTFLPGGRCEAVKKADQRWMVEKTLELNGIIERNALRNGFKYADPVSRFQGHELCSGGDEWFYGLLSGGRFHPTAEGHRAVADAILEAIPLDERPGRTVQQGQTEFYSFFVDPLEALLSIISEWPGSDVEMTLVSPTGKRYTRANPGEGVYPRQRPDVGALRDPEPRGRRLDGRALRRRRRPGRRADEAVDPRRGPAEPASRGEDRPPPRGRPARARRPRLARPGRHDRGARLVRRDRRGRARPPGGRGLDPRRRGAGGDHARRHRRQGADRLRRGLDDADRHQARLDGEPVQPRRARSHPGRAAVERALRRDDGRRDDAALRPEPRRAGPRRPRGRERGRADGPPGALRAPGRRRGPDDAAALHDGDAAGRARLPRLRLGDDRPVAGGRRGGMRAGGLGRPPALAAPD